MLNGQESCRLGVTVPRRVGAAHRRNRVKRLLREVFRHHRGSLAPPIDIVINATPAAADQPKPNLEREFLDGFRRLSARLRG